jgi:hypothetical protein
MSIISNLQRSTMRENKLTEWDKKKRDLEKLKRSLPTKNDPSVIIERKVSEYKVNRENRRSQIQARMVRLGSVSESKEYFNKKEVEAKPKKRVLFDSIYNGKYASRGLG